MADDNEWYRLGPGAAVTDWDPGPPAIFRQHALGHVQADDDVDEQTEVYEPPPPKLLAHDDADD